MGSSGTGSGRNQEPTATDNGQPAPVWVGVCGAGYPFPTVASTDPGTDTVGAAPSLALGFRHVDVIKCDVVIAI